MIEKLEKTIPIKKEEKSDIFDPEGRIKYAKLLFSINRFIMDLTEKKFGSTSWAVENGYAMTTKHYKALQVSGSSFN
jgi:hypothetical protein